MPGSIEPLSVYHSALYADLYFKINGAGRENSTPYESLYLLEKSLWEVTVISLMQGDLFVIDREADKYDCSGKTKISDVMASQFDIPYGRTAFFPETVSHLQDKHLPLHILDLRFTYDEDGLPLFDWDEITEIINLEGTGITKEEIIETATATLLLLSNIAGTWDFFGAESQDAEVIVEQCREQIRRMKVQKRAHPSLVLNCIGRKGIHEYMDAIGRDKIISSAIVSKFEGEAPQDQLFPEVRQFLEAMKYNGRDGLNAKAPNGKASRIDIFTGNQIEYYKDLQSFRSDFIDLYMFYGQISPDFIESVGAMAQQLADLYPRVPHSEMEKRLKQYEVFRAFYFQAFDIYGKDGSEMSEDRARLRFIERAVLILSIDSGKDLKELREFASRYFESMWNMEPFYAPLKEINEFKRKSLMKTLFVRTVLLQREVAEAAGFSISYYKQGRWKAVAIQGPYQISCTDTHASKFESHELLEAYEAEQNQRAAADPQFLAAIDAKIRRELIINKRASVIIDGVVYRIRHENGPKPSGSDGQEDVVTSSSIPQEYSQGSYKDVLSPDQREKFVEVELIDLVTRYFHKGKRTDRIIFQEDIPQIDDLVNRCFNVKKLNHLNTATRRMLLELFFETRAGEFKKLTRKMADINTSSVDWERLTENLIKRLVLYAREWKLQGEDLVKIIRNFENELR